MTFEDELEKFWKAFGEAERKRLEQDPRYQAAMKEKDIARAEELACEYLKGDRKREFL